MNDVNYDQDSGRTVRIGRALANTLAWIMLLGFAAAYSAPLIPILTWTISRGL